ncbi:MAG TPA: type IV pilus twitching motility protein PilT [Gemmatirosa sp.]
MDSILRAAVERGASDLHIKAGDVLRARIDGRLVPLTRQPLTAEQTRSIAHRLLPGEAERARLDAITDYDCSYAVANVGRFRVNIMRQRGAFSAVLRLIPHEVPTLDALGLPPIVARIAEAERGMVLVTGVTGSGKSSTLAAMIRHVNARSEKHILTLENPVEFLHADLKGSVTQREIGVDTESFRAGLRAALRQDPDVILIGEMRDAETVDTALKAAETGHLLLSTLHTPDAQSTVLRTVAMFAAAEQAVVRMRLAESLHAVVSQRLLPRASGRGRVVAAEVMVVTPAIRDLIAEGRVHEVRELIEEGHTQYGMQTFDQHLAELVRREFVTYEVALAAASRPSDFALQFRMLHAAAPVAARERPAPPVLAAVRGDVPASPDAGRAGNGLPAEGAFDFLHG